MRYPDKSNPSRIAAWQSMHTRVRERAGMRQIRACRLQASSGSRDTLMPCRGQRGNTTTGTKKERLELIRRNCIGRSSRKLSARPPFNERWLRCRGCWTGFKEIDMKSIRSAVTVAVLALFASYSAFAQTPSPSRDQVKKETVAAVKAGNVECGDMSKAPAGKSTKKRADVKKGAAEAAKAGDVECGNVPEEMDAKSLRDRGDVKKEAAAAAKADAIAKGNLPAAPKK